MEILESYIAMDRRVALAQGRPLADRAQGAALFADISGFTPLTEALARALGPRRGAEELTVYLNQAYESLIQHVNAFRGSVTAFAGDAITCWFDGDTGARAAACGLAMQESMRPFANLELPGGGAAGLAVKVAIAVGPVRRFLAGNPDVQVLDILAGETLGRMGEAAKYAGRGEVVMDESTAGALVDDLEFSGWKTDSDAGGRIAVVSRCRRSAAFVRWEALPEFAPADLRSWLLQPVYDRVQAAQGEFLTELRPAHVVFVKFQGIDYDHDPEAGSKLDAFVRWVQDVLNRYQGFLLDVSIGDKGSYLYACFGAPIAFENDAWRAIAAAADLAGATSAMPFISSVQVGASGGTLRTGAYGSIHRRTYGVLGEEVNMAARLMEHAASGQVLVSGKLQRLAGPGFRWLEMPPLKVKGRSEPMPLAGLLGLEERSGGGLHEPAYTLPLVGRKTELAMLEDRMHKALRRSGQVMRVVGEAGLGKSRLVAEAMRRARNLGFLVAAGQGLSHRVTSGYLTWQSVWLTLLDVPPGTAAEQIAALESRLAGWDLEWLPRLPLLGPLLDLAIPDNEVTRPLEARLRKAALETMLAEALRALARKRPILIVLEDYHWADSLSRDLLGELSRVIVRLPVMLLLTQRPAELGESTGTLPELPYASALELKPFPDAEVAELASLKLSELFGHQGPPPPALIGRLKSRTGGNPFYIEQVLNLLRDQQIDFQDTDAVTRAELPDSLHALVLSRIDRLSEHQQAALKIASVIGRLFQAAVVFGVQVSSDRARLESDLEQLRRADLTALDRADPELVYMFRQVITQEVAYESLPHATRSRLHNEIGLLLERVHSNGGTQNLDLLAFHFSRTQNLPKKIEYLRKAADAAMARYANGDAIDYLEKYLVLVEGAERGATLLKLGKVRELIGEWKKAGACYQHAFETAESLGDSRGQAQAQVAMGDLLRKQGMYAEAANWLFVAQTRFQDVGDEAGVGLALHAAGTVAAVQGDYTKASEFYNTSLLIRRRLGEQAQEASLLSNLGIIARYQRELDRSRSLNEQSLEIRRRLGDRWAIANSLNNLGIVLMDLRELSRAREVLEESLALNRQVGDRWAVANVLSSLAEVALEQKDWDFATSVLQGSLQINQDLGDRVAVAFVLEYFAFMSAARNEPERALRLAGTASALRERVGSPLSPAEQERWDLALQPARAALGQEAANACLAAGAAAPLETVLPELAPVGQTEWVRRDDLP